MMIPEDERTPGVWYPKNCPETQLISSTAQNMLSMTTPEENKALCGEGCNDSKLGRDIVLFSDNIASCFDSTNYWDQSAAVLSQGGDDFCDEWVYKNVSVVLVSGPLWGTVQAVDNEQGASIKICNSANREKFVELYWAPFRTGLSSDKQYCSNYDPVPVAFDSTKETSGVGDNIISMFLVTICALFLAVEIV